MALWASRVLAPSTAVEDDERSRRRPSKMAQNKGGCEETRCAGVTGNHLRVLGGKRWSVKPRHSRAGELFGYVCSLHKQARRVELVTHLSQKHSIVITTTLSVSTCVRHQLGPLQRVSITGKRVVFLRPLS